MASEVSVPSRGTKLTPADAMRLAIRFAEKGVGGVSPNPLVGCVMVDHNHGFLSVGAHLKYGGDHAEIDALKKLNSQSEITGGHVFVTLEPCAHQGRTGSCAKALAPLKPASLTYAVEDPNPLVAGKGAEILRESGVQVSLLSERADISPFEKIELTEDSEDLAEVFLTNMRSGEIFVAAKLAMSIDGQMGMKSGESKWITGETARLRAHQLRARYDAVAVGVGTFEHDDPSLDVRHADFPGFKNRAVLFDPSGKSFAKLTSSNLYKTRDPRSLIVVTKDGAQEAPGGVRQLRVSVDQSGSFKMPELLAALKAAGLTSIMLEGGAQTFGAFFSARKVRRLHAFVAPVILGGAHGVAWSSIFGGEKISDGLKLTRVHREVLGEDELVSARVH